MNKIFVYNKIWLYFFLIKIIYMFLTIFLLSKFFALADMESYLNGYYYEPINMFISSTNFVGTISHVLYSYLGLIPTNFIFSCLSFYGIYYSVSRMQLSKNNLIFILFLFILPSFSIWTSIVGKEAVSVFFMGILFGYFVDFVNKIRFFNFIELFALYLGILFKPQYILPFIITLFYVYLRKKFNFKKSGDILFLSIIFILTMMFIIIFKNELDNFFLMLPIHFSLEGNSTRQESFWTESLDFLFLLPKGVLLSFIGPNINEVINRLEALPFFLESIFILIILCYLVFKNIAIKINTFKINILVFLVFGILVLTYPLGVSNYMSAIRYREGYYVFIIEIIFYIVYVKNNFLLKNKINNE